MKTVLSVYTNSLHRYLSDHDSLHYDVQRVIRNCPSTNHFEKTVYTYLITEVISIPFNPTRTISFDSSVPYGLSSLYGFASTVRSCLSDLPVISSSSVEIFRNLIYRFFLIPLLSVKSIRGTTRAFCTHCGKLTLYLGISRLWFIL